MHLMRSKHSQQVIYRYFSTVNVAIWRLQCNEKGGWDWATTIRETRNKKSKNPKLLPINLSMNCVWKRNGSFRRPVRNTSIHLSGFMKALGGNNLILFLGYLFLCARYDDDIYSKSYISCGKEGREKGQGEMDGEKINISRKDLLPRNYSINSSSSSRCFFCHSIMI